MEADMALELGFTKQEMDELPRTWFSAAIEALERSDFFSSPSLESLQAICILPMVRNSFDPSVLHCL